MRIRSHYLASVLSLAASSLAQSTTTSSTSHDTFKGESATINPGATSTPALEPVLPPTDDPSNLEILNPAPDVQLFYAGTTSSPLAKRAEDVTADVVLVNIAFSLKYSAVPLDHSAYIATVSCPSRGKLTGSFDTEDAYNFA